MRALAGSSESTDPGFADQTTAYGQNKSRVQFAITTPGPEHLVAPMQWVGLQIRVTRAEHRRETRGFHLAPTLLARLFEMPVIAHFL